ncbi:MAG: serine/threonine protein kinase [Nannocystis sp.]|nr:serine/threonine protein kinase [Nannocystis sp.]
MSKTILSHGLPPDQGPQAWIGRVIDGRYQVQRLLGEGAMGAVFVALRVGFGRRFALKMIQPELAANPEIQDRFEREALASARLNHPHIAGAIDRGNLPGGGAYLVMPLVPGKSLEALLIAKERLRWQDICRIGAQIADALAAAHAIGIVHRDLKPANVLLDRPESGPRATVLDFGVARVSDVVALGLPARDLTRRGMVIGTPGYMAPEQAIGDVVDPRCDLYALGVILWELLAGRPLWSGASLTDLFTRQLSEPPPPLPADAKVGLPPRLEPLILRLCALRQGDRPADAREVRDALLDLLKGTGTSTHAARDSISAPGAARLERRRALAIAGAAALALVIVASIISLAGDDAPRGGAPADAAPAAAAPAAHRPASKPHANDPPATPPGKKPIPAALRGAAAALSSANDPDARQRAAGLVIAHRPLSELPDYLSLLARVESSRRCDEKIRALRALGKTDDRRALAGLSKIAPGSCDPELTRELNAARAALSE